MLNAAKVLNYGKQDSLYLLIFINVRYNS